MSAGRRAVLFDLNGTLTDPAAIGGPWGSPELGIDALAAAIETAMVETILGGYRDFREHLEGGLRRRTRERGLDESRVDEAMEIASALPAFPEATGALQAMAEAGHRLAVLTNSGAEAGRRTLEANGLARRFERILGVDAVEAFKPHPSTYRHALEELGCAAADVTFVSAHPWDLAGAKHAGMRTALVLRGERPSPALPEPDIEAGDLAGVASELGRA